MQSQHKLSSGSEMKQQGVFLLLPADSLYQSLVMLRRSSAGNVKKKIIIFTAAAQLCICLSVPVTKAQ